MSAVSHQNEKTPLPVLDSGAIAWFSDSFS